MSLCTPCRPRQQGTSPIARVLCRLSSLPFPLRSAPTAQHCCPLSLCQMGVRWGSDGCQMEIRWLSACEHVLLPTAKCDRQHALRMDVRWMSDGCQISVRWVSDGTSEGRVGDADAFGCTSVHPTSSPVPISHWHTVPSSEPVADGCQMDVRWGSDGVQISQWHIAVQRACVQPRGRVTGQDCIGHWTGLEGSFL